MAAILNLVRASARVLMAHGYLYKYKPLADGSFNHVREIISESKIFFPRPSQLNDPKECKPTMAIGDITDPIYRPSVEAWIRRLIAHLVPPPSEAEIQAELTNLTQDKFVEELLKADIEYQAGVENCYRILSLADSPVNRHLWDAYAHNFNGVCLQFAVNSRFGDPFQVFYTNSERLLDPTIVNNEYLEKTFLVKRRKWRKEKEFRIIFSEPPNENEPLLIDQKYSFHPSYLTSIFIGYKVTAARRAKLIALAHARKPRLQCFEVFPCGQWPNVYLRPLTIWNRSRHSHFSCAPPRSDAPKQKGRKAQIKWGRLL